jgi:selenocysteine-specific elongation factor
LKSSRRFAPQYEASKAKLFKNRGRTQGHSMAEPRHFIVATAGHVDHGKSALVKALTGTDPDRLPDEKARGITIDLGFAHLELPAAAPANSSFLLGIVDVPGHEDFVKNMVAGVGSIDLALFVIAADDGWMPQTEEHLQILSYLGVSRAVVALTKIDLALDEPSVSANIWEKLRNTPFADAPIIPNSVVTGRGLDHLKAALTSVLSVTRQPEDIGKPRLPVDRVFKLQGIGTIVTGTLTGGTLRRGQAVVIQPSGKKARIRTIQSHNREVDVSGPGTRTALNLPDLSALGDVHRGDTVTLEAFGGPSTIIDVQLEISPRAARPLKEGSRVRIHHGSCNVAAHVAFCHGKDLAAGERALAQLRLEKPSFVFAGDRFIVRDWAEQNTLAGGVVLDPDASRQSFRSEARLRFLGERGKSPEEVSNFVASQIARDGGARRSQLLLKSRFSAEAISGAVTRAAAEGKIMIRGEYVFDAAKWRLWRGLAVDAIDKHHGAHPEQIGVPLTDLRRILNVELPDGDLFDAFAGDLCAGDFVRVGTAIRRTMHRPALPVQLQECGAKLRSTLAAKPFDPPSRKELAPDPVSQQALRFLIATGEAVEINMEVLMTADSVRRATELIRQYLREHGPATVSELRQTLGSSRRVIVPLLERLDRDGVTVRQDDKRSLSRDLRASGNGTR